MWLLKESCDDVPQESAGCISQLSLLWMLCNTFSLIIKNNVRDIDIFALFSN